jgi:hypothetical protein
VAGVTNSPAVYFRSSAALGAKPPIEALASSNNRASRGQRDPSVRDIPIA